MHENTFRDIRRGIFIAFLSNTTINSNVFSNIPSEGIYGYPGGDNVALDGNRFDHVFEPIHLGPGQGSNYDVSGNIITHTTRYGIELQSTFSNIRVSYNYVGQFLPNIDHIALSLAYNPGTNNAEVGYNVLIKDGEDQSNLNNTSAIEAAGSDFSIHNNYIWNWGSGILNGAQRSLRTDNNFFAGTSKFVRDGTPWNPAPPQSGGDISTSLQNAAAKPGHYW